MKIKEKTIEMHLSFILPILITYIFGIIFVAFEAKNSNDNLFEIFLDNIVPTTITYVFGCVLVNISDLFQQNEKAHYVYNIFTCFFVVVYAIIFAFYLSCEYTIWWFIVELILTLMLLHFNVRCYQEKFKNRNHGLV